MRDYRVRQKAGDIVVPVLASEAKMATALVEAKYLAPDLADDRQAIAQALQNMINEFQGE